MTDNVQDTTAVEDRLRTALSSLASTTVVSPDRWDAVESRVDGRRRRRTFVWAVGGPAVALAAVAFLVAVLPARDREPSVVAGPGYPSPLFRYAPQGPAPEEYALQGIEAGGSGHVPANASSVRVYGHRAADGVSLDQVLMVVTARSALDASDLRILRPGSTSAPQCPSEAGCFGLPETEATLRGGQMSVTKGDRTSKVVWDEPGGLTVGVMERGMSEDDFYAAVDRVQVVGEAVAGTLPAGFAEVHTGVWPPLPGLLSPAAVIERWAKSGSEFTLEVHQGPGVSLDTRAWVLGDPVPTTVKGVPALSSSVDQTLTWSPRAGVVLAVSGAGMSEDGLRALAEGVEPITEEHWRQLAGSVPAASPAIATTRPPDQAGATVASGRVDGQDWTISHQESATGAGGCFEVVLATGTAGICDLDIAGANEVGTAQLLGNMTTDGTLSFVVATVGPGVRTVRSEWSDGVAEWTDGPSARTGARIVDVQGTPPSRLLIIPVADWSKSRPTSLTGVDNEGNDLKRKAVAEPSPCWPTCTEPPVLVTTVPPPPATAG